MTTITFRELVTELKSLVPVTYFLYSGGMLTLLLMRHAKSSWDDPDFDDHERLLTKKGKLEAKAAAEFLYDNDLMPEIILCSSAVRATETARCMLEVEPNISLLQRDDLYASSVDKYLNALRGLTMSAERVMIIGHNPELEVFLQLMTLASEGMKTATIARIQFNHSSWVEIDKKMKGEVVAMWRPRS